MWEWAPMRSILVRSRVSESLRSAIGGGC
jgi:hypothetical protein